MNKHLFLGMVATSAMVFATSCSNDEVIEQGAGDIATVSFAINTDGAVASRALSDGSGATRLFYQVYRVENGAYKVADEIKKKDGFHSGDNISLKLAKGQEYAVAFWAQSPESPYVLTSGTNGLEVDMNYDASENNTPVNNTENRDAFFNCAKLTVNGDETKTVTLKRPFAQVNVGASDYDVNHAQIVGSSVTFSNVATTLNLMDGSVSGETTVTFTNNRGELYSEGAVATPTQTLTVNGTNYTWLSMSYVLPTDAEASTTVSSRFEIEVADGENIILEDGLANMPIQRNYRTNIIGSVLTNNVDFKVEIDSEFQNPDNNVEIWDGITKEQPTLNGNTYEIANAAQWAWLGGREITQNIKLTADLDFAGHNVVMLYPTATAELDGNGKTIRNAVYVDSENHQAYKSGLLSFELSNNGQIYTIKNLTIENVTSSNHLIIRNNVYGYAGALVADKQNNGTLNIEGVTVKNSNINGIQSVGALVGLHNGGIINVSNTTVEGNKLGNTAVDEESGYVCGLVGKVVATLNIGENVVVKNNTIDAYYAPRRTAASIDEVAATRGTSASINGSATTSGNTVNKTELAVADIKLNSVADFKAWAEKAAVNPTMYNGKVIALTTDIDLAGYNLKPIGNAANCFMGTFDGRGHTISNLTITEQAGLGEYEAVALFGWIGEGSGYGYIKNLKLSSVNVTGSHYVGALVGYVQFGSIENCSVDGFTLNCVAGENGRDGDKCGGLVGMLNTDAAYVYMKNCSANNGSITAVRDAGQVIGCAKSSIINNNLTNITASNVTVSGTGDNIKNEIIGRILD